MEDDTTSLRLCPSCGEALPLTRKYFKPDKGYTGGFRPRCRVCMGGRFLLDPLPPVPEGFKRCCSCKRIKHKSAFHRWSKASDGLRPKCKDCLALAYQNDIDYQRAIRRAYYQRNREATIMRVKTWHRANVERKRATDRKKSRTAAHRERVKRWQQKNKERMMIYHHARNARKRDLPSTFTEADWQACLAYWDNRCCICGRSPDMWMVLSRDHWIPLSKGGGFTADNIVPTCFARKGAPLGEPSCNASRRDREAADWLVERFGEKKARRVLKSVQKYFEWVKSRDEENSVTSE